jgi:peptidyl-Lys metalloendopeptidase
MLAHKLYYLLFQQFFFQIFIYLNTKEEAVVMQQCLIVVFSIIVVLVAHSCAQDLSVSVVPARSQFTEKQDVEITLNYKNNGPNTVLIYKWYLPSRQLFDPLFEVTRDGKHVEYVGASVKRRSPTVKDMIPLESGKSVSTVVQLSSVYNMTETGNYAVQFKVDVGPMLTTSARSLGTEKTLSVGTTESILLSAPATLFAVGRSNVLIEKSARVDAQVRASTYTYIGCSASRQSSIAAAIKSAASYSSNCVTFLMQLSSMTAPRYTTWFGKYSLNNLVILRAHFDNIYAVLNTKPMSFDCGCNMENTFAYVYRDQPYKIYLCPAFWQASLTGTDSKAGTLVHETSHFTVVAGTNDNVYGQDECKALAKSNPTKAINNADSHEYFAENNPVLQ